MRSGLSHLQAFLIPITKCVIVDFIATGCKKLISLNLHHTRYINRSLKTKNGAWRERFRVLHSGPYNVVRARRKFAPTGRVGSYPSSGGFSWPIQHTLTLSHYNRQNIESRRIQRFIRQVPTQSLAVCVIDPRTTAGIGRFPGQGCTSVSGGLRDARLD
jgi:hypothetical protein